MYTLFILCNLNMHYIIFINKNKELMCLNISETVCPICDNYSAIVKPAQIGYYVKCQTCGTYYLDPSCFEVLNENNKIPNKIRSCIYHYLISRGESLKTTVFSASMDISKNGTYNSNNDILISTKYLLSLYPDNITTKTNKILLCLYSLCNRIGKHFTFCNYIEEYNERLNVLCFVEEDDFNESHKCLKSTLSLLVELSYIKLVNDNDGFENYTFTAKGWQKIQELQENNLISPQGFIAMWFDSSMTTAKQKIIQAITDCKYNAMIIDDKEHNNQIVPEILYEIRKSKFIIADLTGQRNGVYYEAGYAQALGKQVILTCRNISANDESNGLKPHFDVSQKNTIFWSDEEDLYCRLIKRIEATVGKNQ